MLMRGPCHLAGVTQNTPKLTEQCGSRSQIQEQRLAYTIDRHHEKVAAPQLRFVKVIESYQRMAKGAKNDEERNDATDFLPV